MWILPFGLRLGANALIAALIQKTARYGVSFTIPELVLFYTARRRLSWIFLGFIADTKKIWDWKTSFLSNMIAELLLQLAALYTMGTVVYFATSKGYDLASTDVYKAPPGAAYLHTYLYMC